MTKKSVSKTSKAKLSNKASNKKQKAKRRHKLENRAASSGKEVYLPTASVKKATEKKKTEKKAQQKDVINNDVIDDADDEEMLEEIEMDEDLTDFLSEHGTNLSFLAQTLENEPDKKRRKKDSEDLEEYEKVPRKLSAKYKDDDEDKLVHLLPIKGSEGTIISRTTEKVVEPRKEYPTKEPELPEAVAEEPMCYIEQCAQQRRETQQKKIRIAELSQEILEDSEKHISNLKHLLELCRREEPISVRKLSLISLAEVFKDIIPGYRIRELTDTEKAEKVSKDVRMLRNFEEELLAHYKRYLQVLDEMITGCFKLKKRKRDSTNNIKTSTISPQTRQLGVICVRCLCDMLTSVPHFNYRNNLIQAIIPRMNLADELSDVSQICINAVRQTFQKDHVGDISIEVLKQINQLAKAKAGALRPQVLDCLLSVRINSEVIKSAETRDSKKERLEKQREAVRRMSKKERKRKKLSKELDKELQEVEAVESQQKLERHQTELLKFLFVIYFRILKLFQNSALLKPVLKGLSRFAHLINIDFFDDLMNSLKSLLDGEQLSTEERISCIITGLKILSGQGEALTIDPRQFSNALYNILLLVPMNCDDEQHKLILDCLDIVLVKRRKQTSLPYVLAMLKRLSTFSLQSSGKHVMRILFLIRNILQLHKRCDLLLESDSGGSGIFQPELDEPEHCNAQNSTLWELSLVRHHYEAFIEEFSLHLANGAPSQGLGSLSNATLQQFMNSNTEENDGLETYFPKNIPEAPASLKSAKKFRGYVNETFDEYCSTVYADTARIEAEKCVEFYGYV